MAGKMAYAVNFCLDVVARIKGEFTNPLMEAEHPFDHSFIHPAIGRGTADLIFIEPFGRGVVVDWKFGRGWVERAIENAQLQAYGCAAIKEYELQTCDVVIVKAAEFHVDQDTIKAGQDDKLIISELQCIASVASNPFAPLVPTEVGCRYCRALSKCPAALEHIAAYSAAMEKWPELTKMPAVEVARLLKSAGIVKAWCGQLEGVGWGILKAGGTLPGWCLKPGRSLRDWADEVTPEKLREIAAELGKDAEKCIRTELASPAQLEEAWGKAKKVREAMEPLIVKRPGKEQLAQEGTANG
jgi:hypothetical protein